MSQSSEIIVIGGGLAGCEAAWQAANCGFSVALYEMRPTVSTGAHTGADLAELICSNSLGSDLPDRASGLLKQELRRLGSLLLSCADKSAVPAGGALAVDRRDFSRRVTAAIEGHPRIRVFRREVTEIPPDSPVIVASGPLTSGSLAASIQEFTGQDHLYFYDAIAPIIDYDSINMNVAFRASRYERGSQLEGDYINCPMNQSQYEQFEQALLSAERIFLREFEQDVQQGVRAGMHSFFEGCLPIEILARRGPRALAFGPLKPAGITNPHTGRWAYALVQLRQDNLAGSLYNLVGFQTNLTFPDQKRIFRMIPGLEQAEFVRYGQMHRNTFIFSPAVLHPTLQSRRRPDLWFAGQITGAEGYAGNIATGLIAGVNAARHLSGLPPLILPSTTMLGALLQYISAANPADFQPMKANYGLLPPLDHPSRLTRRDRAGLFARRARADLVAYLNSNISEISNYSEA